MLTRLVKPKKLVKKKPPAKRKKLAKLKQHVSKQQNWLPNRPERLLNGGHLRMLWLKKKLSCRSWRTRNARDQCRP